MKSSKYYFVNMKVSFLIKSVSLMVLEHIGQSPEDFK